MTIPVSRMTDAEILAELGTIKRDLAVMEVRLLRSSMEVAEAENTLAGRPHCLRFYGDAHEIEVGGGGVVVSGYASLWGVRDDHGDIMQRGCFRKSLMRHQAETTKPLMLWQHIAEQVIGVWDEIAEDWRGLRVAGRLLTTIPKAAEARELLANGALRGLSVGMNLRQTERVANGNRAITEADLREISLVSFPALRSALLA
jgi:HK97 family phage prohead protease